MLCHSEEVSRKAAAEVMRELYGLEVGPLAIISFPLMLFIYSSLRLHGSTQAVAAASDATDRQAVL